MVCRRWITGAWLWREKPTKQKPVCLVGFSRQPGCVSQDHWSLALEMRPICSYLVSLAQGALRIVRVWIQIYMQATKHRARTRIARLIATKQQLPASHDASTRRCRQPNRPLVIEPCFTSDRSQGSSYGWWRLAEKKGCRLAEKKGHMLVEEGWQGGWTTTMDWPWHGYDSGRHGYESVDGSVRFL
jgi:hypothetical protein